MLKQNSRDFSVPGVLLPEDPRIFDNRWWRELTENVGNKVSKLHGLKVKVITPFGFEVTENKTYLFKNLRKFYCYLGVEKSYQNKRELVTKDYKQLLFKDLKVENPVFFADVIVAIENDRLEKLRPNNYVPKQQDKLIDIQFRAVEKSILLDYADYIIANLSGLANLQGESAKYYANAVHRSRTLQLYVMQECLFGNLIEPMKLAEKVLFGETFKYIHNMLRIYATEKPAEIEATVEEKLIYEELIVNRVRLMIKAVNQNNEKTTINCVDYHAYRPLNLLIDTVAYDNAVDKIARTYSNFV